MEKTDCIVLVSLIVGMFFTICFAIYGYHQKQTKAFELGYKQVQCIGNAAIYWTK